MNNQTENPKEEQVENPKEEQPLKPKKVWIEPELKLLDVNTGHAYGAFENEIYSPSS